MSLLYPTDETYMQMALREAAKAYQQGEVPIGAIVVHGNKVVGRAYNQVELLNDGTAHAEMLALTQAATAIGDWRLTDTVLYVTKEPCAMCAGAMVNCRVGKVVFGASDPRSGGAGGALDITGFPGMLHQVQVVRGVLHDDCLGLIQAFFQERRREAKEGKHLDGD